MDETGVGCLCLHVAMAKAVVDGSIQRILRFIDLLSGKIPFFSNSLEISYHVIMRLIKSHHVKILLKSHA